MRNKKVREELEEEEKNNAQRIYGQSKRIETSRTKDPVAVGVLEIASNLAQNIERGGRPPKLKKEREGEISVVLEREMIRREKR